MKVVCTTSLTKVGISTTSQTKSLLVLYSRVVRCNSAGVWYYSSYSIHLNLQCGLYYTTIVQGKYGKFGAICGDIEHVISPCILPPLICHFQLPGSSGHRPLSIAQYHFTAWPDHGVPDYATPILAFHRRVKSKHNPRRGPLLVHCRYMCSRPGLRD